MNKRYKLQNEIQRMNLYYTDDTTILSHEDLDVDIFKMERARSLSNRVNSAFVLLSLYPELDGFIEKDCVFTNGIGRLGDIWYNFSGSEGAYLHFTHANWNITIPITPDLIIPSWFSSGGGITMMCEGDITCSIITLERRIRRHCVIDWGTNGFFLNHRCIWIEDKFVDTGSREYRIKVGACQTSTKSLSHQKCCIM
jgi:hypothetical protein